MIDGNLIQCVEVSTKIVKKLLNPKTPNELIIALKLISEKYVGKPNTSSMCIEIAAEVDVLLNRAFQNGVLKKKYTSAGSRGRASVNIAIFDPDTDIEVKEFEETLCVIST